MCIQPMKKYQDTQKKRQGYPDVLCYARRYTRRSTPVLAGQGAAAAAKLSHDEETGRESRRAATGCPGSVGPILAAGETRL